MHDLFYLFSTCLGIMYLFREIPPNIFFQYYRKKFGCNASINIKPYYNLYKTCTQNVKLDCQNEQHLEKTDITHICESFYNRKHQNIFLEEHILHTRSLWKLNTFYKLFWLDFVLTSIQIVSNTNSFVSFTLLHRTIQNWKKTFGEKKIFLKDKLTIIIKTCQKVL